MQREYYYCVCTVPIRAILCKQSKDSTLCAYVACSTHIRTWSYVHVRKPHAQCVRTYIYVCTPVREHPLYTLFSTHKHVHTHLQCSYRRNRHLESRLYMNLIPDKLDHTQCIPALCHMEILVTCTYMYMYRHKEF